MSRILAFTACLCLVSAAKGADDSISCDPDTRAAQVCHVHPEIPGIYSIKGEFRGVKTPAGSGTVLMRITVDDHLCGDEVKHNLSDGKELTVASCMPSLDATDHTVYVDATHNDGVDPIDRPPAKSLVTSIRRVH